jgi:hypothetical protein
LGKAKIGHKILDAFRYEIDACCFGPETAASPHSAFVVDPKFYGADGIFLEARAVLVARFQLGYSIGADEAARPHADGGGYSRFLAQTRMVLSRRKTTRRKNEEAHGMTALRAIAAYCAYSRGGID